MPRSWNRAPQSQTVRPHAHPWLRVRISLSHFVLSGLVGWVLSMSITLQAKRCHQSGYIRTRSKEVVPGFANRKVTSLPATDRTCLVRRLSSVWQCLVWDPGRSATLLNLPRWASTTNFRSWSEMYKFIRFYCLKCNIYFVNVTAISEYCNAFYFRSTSLFF